MNEREIIEGMLSARATARKEKNWAEADRIRRELLEMGIMPEDKADGSYDWRRYS